ncbi:MAG: Maf-like protein [Pseudomonadota bacterium]
MMQSLILASTSAIRATLMSNAGLEFDAIPADVDERAIEEPLLEADFLPEDIASVLAEAKAIDVSERFPGALVVGADQILAFQGRRWVKADSMDEARSNLLTLRGQTHELHAAVVCARDGAAVWRHVSTANLTMRAFSPEFLGRYLASVGDKALSSVGAYQLEGEGVQLFERIDGDYFTILGLPLLPLLAFLRSETVIDD